MHPTRIAELSAAPLDLPLTEPFAIATGAQHLAQNVLVRLTLADGTVGLGEAAPFPAVSGETQACAIAAVARSAALLQDRDARSWRQTAELLGQQLPDETAARCGIEMALFDALARHYRLPLWTFFGGCGTALETDMTVTAGDSAHAVEAARAIVARGIDVIKVKVGALNPESDVERLQAIYQAVPQARLIADANGGYTPSQALAFLEALQARQLPLELLEQPVPRENWEGMAEVTRRSQVAIYADESARSPADVLRLIREGGAHGINIKLMKCGVAEALSMWEIARSGGLGLMIGGMVESLLAMTFSAHFAAGLGGFAYVDLDTPMFIASHPFSGGFRQSGACLSLDHIQSGHGDDV